mmetsp:Transcript_7093/g.22712  ORF Transcript_7093/g.22712 Transcript_7093/m.22712 type:complete len:282 (+) Transcript_7093:300-1145(+)
MQSLCSSGQRVPEVLQRVARFLLDPPNLRGGQVAGVVARAALAEEGARRSLACWRVGQRPRVLVERRHLAQRHVEPLVQCAAFSLRVRDEFLVPHDASESLVHRPLQHSQVGRNRDCPLPSNVANARFTASKELPRRLALEGMAVTKEGTANSWVGNEHGRHGVGPTRVVKPTKEHLVKGHGDDDVPTIPNNVNVPSTGDEHALVGGTDGALFCTPANTIVGNGKRLQHRLEGDQRDGRKGTRNGFGTTSSPILGAHLANGVGEKVESELGRSPSNGGMLG